MFRRFLIGSAFTFLLLGAVAFYFLHATQPTLPVGPVVKMELGIGGYQRHFLVFTPTQVREGASVLFVFHSSQSSAEEIRRVVGGVLERLAEQDNVIVVYPDGYEGHFNDCRREASYSARTLNIDDVAFTKAMIDSLFAQRPINREKVYAIGYSNGGQMALRLALEAPERVRGVASIAANLPAPDNMACKPAALPARFIGFVAGTQDPVNPYKGGQVTLFGFGNRGNVLSARESAQWFANALGLAAAEEQKQVLESASGLGAYRQDWISTDGHVRLLTIEGGGHTVPQADYLYPLIFGATFRSDSVLEETWRMLSSNTH
jgi:polyhydroxybutyrate depolymerase